MPKFTVIAYAPYGQKTVAVKTTASTAKGAADLFLAQQDETGIPLTTIDTVYQFVCVVPGHIDPPYSAEDL